MERPHRHHSPEFKRDAVTLVVKHDDSCATAGRSLGVRAALIVRWKGELEGHAAEAFPVKDKRTAKQQHIHEQEPENWRLRIKRDILKNHSDVWGHHLW